MKSEKVYRKQIEDYLIGRYGKIQPEWALVIDLLIDNLIKYQKLQEVIDEYGYFNKDTFKTNPAIARQKDIQASIFKQIQSLGLSPYHNSKIKVIEQDDQANLLASLLTGSDD